jgi:hypothetical protein
MIKLYSNGDKYEYKSGEPRVPPGQALFMVKSRTVCNLHPVAIIGDVFPSSTTNCCLYR